MFNMVQTNIQRIAQPTKPKKVKMVKYPIKIGRLPLFLPHNKPLNSKIHVGAWGQVNFYKTVMLNCRHEGIWVKLFNQCMDKGDHTCTITVKKEQDKQLIKDLNNCQMIITIPHQKGDGKHPLEYPDRMLVLKAQQDDDLTIHIPAGLYELKTCDLDGNVIDSLKGQFNKSLYRFISCHFKAPYRYKISTLQAVLAPEQRTCDFVRSLKSGLKVLECKGVVSTWSVDLTSITGDRMASWQK